MKIFEMPEFKPFSFHSSKQVYEQMEEYKKADREIFLIIFLSSKNQAIKIETHSVGTIDNSYVHPREVMKSALYNQATSLIFVHNHPSGDPEPSFGDDDITKRLIAAAKLLDVKVLDHVIIGNGKYYSYADEGRIDEFNIIAQQTLNSF